MSFESDLFGPRPRRTRSAAFRSGRPPYESHEDAPEHAYESREAIEATDERVIGVDDRVQVLARSTHPSTRLFPFNTICYIEQSSTLNASGTLIAPRVVLTARHVLDGPAQVTISPGADLSASTPALQRPATPQSQIVPSAQFRLHTSLDLGLAIMPVAFTRPSEFMMLQFRSDANTATLLSNAGYPRVPPGGAVRGTMWRHTKQIQVTGVAATRLSYQLDTTVGHSGSPLWLLGNDEIRLLLAVHTNGPSGADNFGVRITCAVIDWIESECRTAGVGGPRVDRVAYRALCPRP